MAASFEDRRLTNFSGVDRTLPYEVLTTPTLEPQSKTSSNFEQRTGRLGAARGAKNDLVLAAFERLPRHFVHADLARADGVLHRLVSAIVGSRNPAGGCMV
jgi:hypothetical protein